VPALLRESVDCSLVKEFFALQRIGASHAALGSKKLKALTTCRRNPIRAAKLVRAHSAVSGGAEPWRRLMG
jgi:hypothetical protein